MSWHVQSGLSAQQSAMIFPKLNAHYLSLLFAAMLAEQPSRSARHRRRAAALPCSSDEARLTNSSVAANSAQGNEECYMADITFERVAVQCYIDNYSSLRHPKRVQC